MQFDSDRSLGNRPKLLSQSLPDRVGYSWDPNALVDRVKRNEVFIIGVAGMKSLLRLPTPFRWYRLRKNISVLYYSRYIEETTSKYQYSCSHHFSRLFLQKSHKRAVRER